MTQYWNWLLQLDTIVCKFVGQQSLGSPVLNSVPSHAELRKISSSFRMLLQQPSTVPAPIQIKSSIFKRGRGTNEFFLPYFIIFKHWMWRKVIQKLVLRAFILFPSTYTTQQNILLEKKHSRNVICRRHLKDLKVIVFPQIEQWFNSWLFIGEGTPKTIETKINPFTR